MKKLNVGCGTDIRPGWINMDIAQLDGVDVIHDINLLPLPFENESIDEILCQDILEHIEYPPVLKELHRILKKGGIITIRVPHFTSKNNYIDPTHKRLFSIRTFDFFTKDSFMGRNYYYDFAFSEIVSRKLTFQKGILFFFNYGVELIFGNRITILDFYEGSFLSRLFPGENIIIKLKK
ncbi:methyltransferase domain-containing protein [Runella sp. SP2]|uniref:class I SAM-dependent methyltransferase n=1 Tax=Runella sp. SP2 TaxID=2268026 RepID=UPI000F07AE53|nr:methyltransferase domain-containing protein [Runella sp. SP2]AYQ30773.1 methyltransferase domain-containing protein [Runella sp. SP2]